jgi:hypothetical protein
VGSELASAFVTAESGAMAQPIAFVSSKEAEINIFVGYVLAAMSSPSWQ